MPDLIHGIDHYLRYPLLLDFINPSGVVVVDGQFKVRDLVCDVELLPEVDVFELYLPFLCALVADVCLDEVLNQLDWVLGEEVL